MRENIIATIHFENKFNEKFKIIVLPDENPDNQLKNNIPVYEFELYFEQDNIEFDNWIESNFGYDNIADIISDCKESVNKFIKNKNKFYYIQKNIGKSKYILNYYDGIQTHKDGSPFFDIKIFSNIRELNKKIKELRKSGYKERY